MEIVLDAPRQELRLISSPRPNLNQTTLARPRLDAIDWLRGLVMVIMVLDHTRDFLGASSVNPRDVNDSALFLTRWITHFCAPIFVFLAGVSAFLYASRGRGKSEISRFLLTRGLWLVFVELVVMRFAWTFSVQVDFIFLQVIWAIGVSMITLAGLVYLPRKAIAVFALVMIAGHNLLDGIRAESFGAASWLWMMLHEPGFVHPSEGKTLFMLYPLIPWIGVMAAGYVFGPIMLMEARQRRKWTFSLGLGATLLFVGLRAANVYGDPAAWTPQDNWLATSLAFINCEKYPPSLLFLTMTLGPALMALAGVHELKGKLARMVVTIGRTPFLFYVVHAFLIHAVTVIAAHALYGDTAWLFRGMPPMSKPENYGLSLPVIYAAWLAILVMLYPLCHWFAEVKQRRKDWWLSYL
ncbi:DUF1624 domain-containing protein [candidate division KSB1 bacterium]|nr:MAG: DUF1624 domain-containing protein [candidate division KSB1 bacterium]MBC6950365.1 DUF1624 domain-containing protein [candidate division KSB1 bacterium]MCE7944947.1 DUF1624 domain-containing protein [Chlorobi bacterium CHB1]MDL1877757.1 DUF1624 domain-containing protein [Cytophagia bacterium CHB2]